MKYMNKKKQQHLLKPLPWIGEYLSGLENKVLVLCWGKRQQYRAGEDAAAASWFSPMHVLQLRLYKQTWEVVQSGLAK
jgi:hypothetical protein